jgi:hypothetical protein
VNWRVGIEPMRAPGRRAKNLLIVIRAKAIFAPTNDDGASHDNLIRQTPFPLTGFALIDILILPSLDNPDNLSVAMWANFGILDTGSRVAGIVIH